LKDEYRLNKEAFDRKYPGVSEGWKKDVKANKARKRQQKLEEEGRSYKLVMSPETEVSCFPSLLDFHWGWRVTSSSSPF